MAMKIETVWAALDSLLDYAKDCEDVYKRQAFQIHAFRIRRR